MSTPPHPNWLHWLDTCPSTNTWALAQRSILTHGDVVYTPHQTAGRGQRGRSWQAPPGVLTTSIGLVISPTQLSGLSLVAGLAVIQAVEALVPELTGTLKLKWPNDVVIGQRKLAGILCETGSSDPTQPVWVVVGIGLNQAAEFTDPTLATKAISLSQLVGQVPTPLDLLASLRQSLLEWVTLMGQTGIATLLHQSTHRDALHGSMLTFAPGEQVPWLVGQGAGWGTGGEFLMQTATGQIQAFTSGRVMTWQPAGEQLRADQESLTLTQPRSRSLLT